MRARVSFEHLGIGSLLKQNLLRVPPNQRDYAWTEREVEQLFTDFARAIENNDDYFLGTIVTIPRQATLEVVDGQQRLATTAILLSAIRLYMSKLGESILDQAIQEFLIGIDRQKRERIPRMTLNSTDHDLFRTIVTHDGENDLPEPGFASQRLLLNAYHQASTFVLKIVSTHQRQDHGDRLNAWVTFLERRASVILLKAPDDSDAYRMFETLNDRGLRTSQADLIKNYLFGRAGERITEVQHSWAFMRGTLETINERDITVTFLRQALILLHGHLRTSEVYSKVQETINSESTAVSFASDLDLLATTYAAIFNPAHNSWNPHLPQTREAIRVLDILNIRPLRPTVLACAARILHQTELANALQFLLSLGVRLLIASSTRSQAVEAPLANAAHSLWEGHVTTANQLRTALKSITPSDEAFRTACETARVSNARLARYYLRSLETAAKDEDEPWFIPIDDGTVINLEHILPKKPGDNWPLFNEDEVRLYGSRLGNLALMRARDNSTVRSAPFADKRPFFSQSPYVLTNHVANYTRWTVAAITKRQAELARLAPKAWPIR